MVTPSRRLGMRAGWLAARLWAAGWLVFGAVALRPASADPPQARTDGEAVEDANPYQNGVIARYTGADGVEHARTEDAIALASGNRAPEPRVPPGPFESAFDSRLLVQSPGVHRLRVFAAGRVQLTLGGKLLLDSRAREPGWLDGEPIDLQFGYHALEVRYRREDEPARLALFWEGPGFQLEPLAARWLFHASRDTPSDDFESGRRWVRALRCSACHDVPDQGDALAAPALDRLAGNISRAWIVERLAEAPDAAPREAAGGLSRRMPHFALERSEANAVADYLLARSEGLPSRPAKATGPQRIAGRVVTRLGRHGELEFPDAAAGGRLFRGLGCLACHRVGDLGSDGPFGGGDLSTVAAKRPADFFARWLADPATINRDHRMPVFALDALESAHLALYLCSLGQPPSANTDAEAANVERGAKLVRQLRCGACHALPKSDAAPLERLPLDVAAAAHDQNHCLFEADRTAARPGYLLDDKTRRVVRAYLSGMSRVKHPGPPDGRDLLAERNCLSCHARQRAPGLAGVLPAVADADPTLRDVLAGLTPPSLTGVGDKLLDEALVASITASRAPRQTWLRVRMPKFPLSPQETATLARYFVDADRMPEHPQAPPATPAASDPAIEGAGARLVTADGFGCTSCHAIGKWKPRNVALAAAGADLSRIGARVRRAWFDRFVSNPVRVVPQMEMPAIQQPIRGVLEGKLDGQIAAVWDVLDRQGFTPPAPNALRVVRRANLPDVEERAAVLTDVIEVGEHAFVKPLVIGLPNRHNVLYDLATARLAAWWTGDVARQQTRGKTWFWEAGVPQLLALDDSPAARGELVLVADGKRFEVLPRGQYATEFDALAHVERGIEVSHRLQFRLDDGDELLHVTQRFLALPADTRGGVSGFRRTMRIESLSSGTQAELLALSGAVAIDPGGRSARLVGQGATLQVSLRLPAAGRFSENARGALVTLAGAGERPVVFELDYTVNIAVDQFIPRPAPDRSVTRAELAVVSGFDATRLPVSDQCMPTGLAWRPDGTLVVSSLEGRVWLGHDTDGNGLEDKLAPFSDDLAAPFGVAAAGDAIDVINKYGLLRLLDVDGDGTADRTELIASGWGHTRDYHDWAVGLPRDAAGNYYVSLPCQQDDRSEAAATLRGTVIRMVPRQPTADDPRRFAIVPLCGGLRFGQGIALSPAGQLFVTDNQGNYNPFNELNHIVQGARYGFINRLESKRGFAPAFRPAAIEIPHPWTRSVNGICFLTVPSEYVARVGERPFGPFTGHLVGCEYDTRRLVRMSLQQVGDTWQGAVYPLSREPAAGEETFEGPVACQVSPRGDVYVGNLRDSGWGGGSNTGSLVRLRWRGNLPAGIAEVRARPGGFSIDFTAPVERGRAAEAGNYAVSSYRRISTPSYGGPDVDRRVETIRAVQVAEDGRRAVIDLADLRAGFVYEFHVRDLVADAPFFPNEAYYTLRSEPK